MLHLQQLSVISPEAYNWYRKRHSLRDIAQQPYQEMAYCVGWESNPGQLLGRQLCSPLYHQRLISCRFWYVLNDIKISTEYHNSKLIQSAAHTIIFTIFSQGTLQATLVLRKINSVVYFISVYQQHKFLYLLTLLRAKYFEQKLRCELQKGALYFMLR